MRAGDYLRLNKNGLLRTTGRLNEARRRRRRSARRRSNGTKASGAAASAVAMITAPELRCILPRHGGTEGDGAAPGRGWCAPRRCVGLRGCGAGRVRCVGGWRAAYRQPRSVGARDRRAGGSRLGDVPGKPSGRHRVLAGPARPRLDDTGKQASRETALLHVHGQGGPGGVVAVARGCEASRPRTLGLAQARHHGDRVRDDAGRWRRRVQNSDQR